MKLYIAPEKIRSFEEFLDDKLPVIFLAGSIDQGTADKWQERIIKELSDSNCIVLNPRREQWDSSWEQSINNKVFKELGMVGTDKKKEVIIYCPNGFYRKGNVDIFAELYDLKVYTNEKDLIKKIKELI